jgi:hypothetical protein
VANNDVAPRYFIQNLEHFDLDEVRKGNVPTLIQASDFEQPDEAEKELVTAD